MSKFAQIMKFLGTKGWISFILQGSLLGLLVGFDRGILHATITALIGGFCGFLLSKSYDSWYKKLNEGEMDNGNKK